MAIIYFNVPGSAGGGGPSVFVYKAAKKFIEYGHKVIYDDPRQSDAALCIIESGKVLKNINRKKTRVVVRLDGAYFKEYWHSETIDRMWRIDMTNLHNAIKRDVSSVDFMVYQSQFSKSLIDKEIAKRQGKYAIIHNGVDVGLFKPGKRQPDGFINLFHIGKIRNGYIMESLIGVYQELKKRGNKVKLILAGSMDAECTSIYNMHKNDLDIKSLGPCSNTSAVKAFAQGDIYLGPRMGSSCDNVIVEALACGLPVVVPAWGGNSELFNDGQEGIIVDSGGHWNYGQKYIELLADGVEKIIPGLNNFKQRARQHAIKEFTIEKMVNEYLKALGI
jgi:glycosyltransferase involved in cell wall biosynthesis